MVSGVEARVDAFFGSYKIETEGFMCIFRALNGDEVEATSMNFFDVIKPQGKFILLAQDFMQTLLTEIFLEDFLALDVHELSAGVVWCTVSSIRKAFFAFKANFTHWTCPSDETWSEINVSLKFMDILVELFEEVKCKYVV